MALQSRQNADGVSERSSDDNEFTLQSLASFDRVRTASDGWAEEFVDRELCTHHEGKSHPHLQEQCLSRRQTC